jgi:hypothetical protein
MPRGMCFLCRIHGVFVLGISTTGKRRYIVENRPTFVKTKVGGYINLALVRIIDVEKDKVVFVFCDNETIDVPLDEGLGIIDKMGNNGLTLL